MQLTSTYSVIASLLLLNLHPTEAQEGKPTQEATAEAAGNNRRRTKLVISCLDMGNGRAAFKASPEKVASPERFELPTRCLGRSRSIQLSYGDVGADPSAAGPRSQVIRPAARPPCPAVYAL